MKLTTLIKSELKNFFLVLAYIGLAMTVYIIWFDSLWHLWYVDAITGVIIFASGVALGYLYLKSEYNHKHKAESNVSESTDTKEDNLKEEGEK